MREISGLALSTPPRISAPSPGVIGGSSRSFAGGAGHGSGAGSTSFPHSSGPSSHHAAARIQHPSGSPFVPPTMPQMAAATFAKPSSSVSQSQSVQSVDAFGAGATMPHRFHTPHGQQLQVGGTNSGNSNSRLSGRAANNSQNTSHGGPGYPSPYSYPGAGCGSNENSFLGRSSPGHLPFDTTAQNPPTPGAGPNGQEFPYSIISSLIASAPAAAMGISGPSPHVPPPTASPSIAAQIHSQHGSRVQQQPHSQHAGTQHGAPHHSHRQTHHQPVQQQSLPLHRDGSAGDAAPKYGSSPTPASHNIFLSPMHQQQHYGGSVVSGGRPVGIAGYTPPHGMHQPAHHPTYHHHQQHSLPQQHASFQQQQQQLAAHMHQQHRSRSFNANHTQSNQFDDDNVLINELAPVASNQPSSQQKHPAAATQSYQGPASQAVTASRNTGVGYGAHDDQHHGGSTHKSGTKPPSGKISKPKPQPPAHAPPPSEILGAAGDVAHPQQIFPSTHAGFASHQGHSSTAIHKGGKSKIGVQSQHNYYQHSQYTAAHHGQYRTAVRPQHSYYPSHKTTYHQGSGGKHHQKLAHNCNSSHSGAGRGPCDTSALVDDCSDDDLDTSPAVFFATPLTAYALQHIKITNESDIERNPRRLESREKQVGFGKETEGYKNYRKALLKEFRQWNNPMHPNTPRVEFARPRRKFKRAIQMWRQALHAWDGRYVADETIVEGLETLKELGYEGGDGSIPIRDPPPPPAADLQAHWVNFFASSPRIGQHKGHHVDQQNDDDFENREEGHSTSRLHVKLGDGGNQRHVSNRRNSAEFQTKNKTPTHGGARSPSETEDDDFADSERASPALHWTIDPPAAYELTNIKLAPHETVAKAVTSREKQVTYGKETEGYRNYRAALPKEDRQWNNPAHPNTPRVEFDRPRRKFKRAITLWRQALHAWDDRDTADDTFIEGLATLKDLGYEGGNGSILIRDSPPLYPSVDGKVQSGIHVHAATTAVSASVSPAFVSSMTPNQSDVPNIASESTTKALVPAPRTITGSPTSTTVHLSNSETQITTTITVMVSTSSSAPVVPEIVTSVSANDLAASSSYSNQPSHVRTSHSNSMTNLADMMVPVGRRTVPEDSSPLEHVSSSSPDNLNTSNFLMGRISPTTHHVVVSLAGEHVSTQTMSGPQFSGRNQSQNVHDTSTHVLSHRTSPIGATMSRSINMTPQNQVVPPARSGTSSPAWRQTQQSYESPIQTVTGSPLTAAAETMSQPQPQQLQYGIIKSTPRSSRQCTPVTEIKPQQRYSPQHPPTQQGQGAQQPPQVSQQGQPSHQQQSRRISSRLSPHVVTQPQQQQQQRATQQQYQQSPSQQLQLGSATPNSNTAMLPATHRQSASPHSHLPPGPGQGNNTPNLHTQPSHSNLSNSSGQQSQTHYGNMNPTSTTQQMLTFEESHIGQHQRRRLQDSLERIVVASTTDLVVNRGKQLFEATFFLDQKGFVRQSLHPKGHVSFFPIRAAGARGRMAGTVVS